MDVIGRLRREHAVESNVGNSCRVGDFKLMDAGHDLFRGSFTQVCHPFTTAYMVRNLRIERRSRKV